MTDQGSAFKPADAQQPSTDGMLGVVGQIYSATLEADTWPRILASIAPLVGATKGLLTIVDAIHPSATESIMVGLEPEAANAFATRDLARDLLFSACRRLPPETVATGGELVDRALLYAHPAWVPFRVAGVDYQLLAVLENRADMCAILGLVRGDQEFTPSEKEILRGLVSHLRRALNISTRLRLAEAGRHELIQKFDRARQAVVVLDRSGYALLINVTARTLLDRGDGLSIKFGRFLFDEVAMQSRFETAVRRALSPADSDDGVGRMDIRVSRPSGKAPLELGVIPVRRPSDRALMPEGSGCIVIINDPALPQVIAPDRLVRLYGLTAAEAKVCEALLAAGSANEAAELLHIAPNTARSHLKSIFDKIGVANQAQLMQRLTMLSRPPTPMDVFGAGIPTGG